MIDNEKLHEVVRTWRDAGHCGEELTAAFEEIARVAVARCKLRFHDAAITADDLRQEILVDLVRSVEGFNPCGLYEVGPYFWQVAQNCLRRLLAKRTTQSRTPLGKRVPLDENISRCFRLARLTALEPSSFHWRPEHTDYALRKRAEGWPYWRIAARLGCCRSTVSKALQRTA